MGVMGLIHSHKPTLWTFMWFHLDRAMSYDMVKFLGDVIIP